jgi:hypothetical protein
MERQQTLAKERRNERKAALERAVTLKVPFAFSPDEVNDEDESDAASIVVDEQGQSIDPEPAETSWRDGSGDAKASNWTDLVDRLFSKSTSQREQEDEEENPALVGVTGREGTVASEKSSRWSDLVDRVFSRSTSQSKSRQKTSEEKKRPLLS